MPGPGTDWVRGLFEPLVQPLAQLLRVVLALSAPLARDDHAGGRHAREAGEAEELPGHAHEFAYLTAGEHDPPGPRRGPRDGGDRRSVAVPRPLARRPRDPGVHQQPD